MEIYLEDDVIRYMDKKNTKTLTMSLHKSSGG